MTSGANGERRSMVVEIRVASDPQFAGRTVYRAFTLAGNPLHVAAFRVTALKERLQHLYPGRDIAFLGPITGEREHLLARVAVEVARQLPLSGDGAQRLHQLLRHQLAQQKLDLVPLPEEA